ncbi:MAG: hypothetical protein HQM08_26620 [Candidatus Riflebacteria bacterium]|nr:hypothetical protein [Candidatus Riflebacteria bacterium]
MSENSVEEYCQKLEKSNQELEKLLSAANSELEKIQITLFKKRREKSRNERKVKLYQKKLRHLISKQAQIEERERKIIAADLHDHLGQALAWLKTKVVQLHGEAIFYGLDHQVDEIGKLVNQIIKYTRGLTSEISPSALYELGLQPGIEWLADWFKQKYKLNISLQFIGQSFTIQEKIAGIIFRAIRELLMNIVKHSGTLEADVHLIWQKDRVLVEIIDKGKGFEKVELKRKIWEEQCFGLFNLKEQFRQIEGSVELISNSGKGVHAVCTVPIKNEQNIQNQSETTKNLSPLSGKSLEK